MKTNKISLIFILLFILLLITIFISSKNIFGINDYLSKEFNQPTIREIISDKDSIVLNYLLNEKELSNHWSFKSITIRQGQYINEIDSSRFDQVNKNFEGWFKEDTISIKQSVIINDTIQNYETLAINDINYYLYNIFYIDDVTLPMTIESRNFIGKCVYQDKNSYGFGGTTCICIAYDEYLYNEIVLLIDNQLPYDDIELIMFELMDQENMKKIYH